MADISLAQPGRCAQHMLTNSGCARAGSISRPHRLNGLTGLPLLAGQPEFQGKQRSQAERPKIPGGDDIGPVIPARLARVARKQDRTGAHQRTTSAIVHQLVAMGDEQYCTALVARRRISRSMSPSESTSMPESGSSRIARPRPSRTRRPTRRACARRPKAFDRRRESHRFWPAARRLPARR